MRPFFFVRMGCLGWVLIGWLVLAVYALALFAVLTLAGALAVVAGAGMGGDWMLRTANARYRERRTKTPLRWPAEVLGAANGMLASLFRQRRTAAIPGTVVATRPVAAAPPAWYGDSMHPGQWRWWDGTRWTDQTSPMDSTT